MLMPALLQVMWKLVQAEDEDITRCSRRLLARHIAPELMLVLRWLLIVSHGDFSPRGLALHWNAKRSSSS